MELSILLVFLGALNLSFGQYTANWSSIDSRPLPTWYDDAKIGIFLHWGVYSVPSYGSEWFWQNWQGYENAKDIKYMEDNYPPGFSYHDFGPMFTAEFFDPDEWAKLFEAAGAKYVVLTSKHHEGYTMWPSKYSWSWNSMDVGSHRDLLGELATSLRNLTSLKFGLYHSLYEWFNPLYLQDKNNNFTTYEFRDFKTLPELYEITNNYLPEIIWSDGEWETIDTYWNSTVYLAWLFNESPVKDTVVVNDRWGSGTLCKHGSFYTCADRYNPGVLQPHKWENCMTLDLRSWGFRRTASFKDYMSIERLLKTLIETISCGGNLLVNAGPTHDGRIIPIMEERLLQMGEWLSLNGEAIYSSKPWLFQNDTTTSGVWYTQNNGSVYATMLDWPKDGLLLLGSVTSDTVAADCPTVTCTVTMLGFEGNLETKDSPEGLVITLPSMAQVSGKYAWVLKLDGLKLKEA